MIRARRQAIVAVALMGSAAALAYVGQPRTRLADVGPPLDLDAAFPMRFGSWRFDEHTPVILPAPDMQASLDRLYNKVISRTYVNTAGDRVMLSVAYGGDQSDGMNIHLPEVCYPAQGFQLLSRKRGEVQADQRQIPVVQLVTKQGARTEPVTYWITVGDAVVPSRTDQKLVQIRYGLQGMIPDGMLVRVSSIDKDVSRAFAIQAGFIAELAESVPEAARPRVLGAR